MAALRDEIGLAALLERLPGDLPTGADPREDFSPQAPYRLLRNARAAARTAERAVDMGGEDAGPPGEWRQVRQIGLKILAEQSKDLEIAAWVTEALVRQQGLSGLDAGAALIEGLTRSFWNEGLHPVPDGDGMEGRVAPIEGLSGATGDGTLMQPLRKLPLFRRPDGEPVALWNYSQSEALASEPDAKKVQARIAAGVVAFSDMDQWARASGGAHFAALRAETRAALASWNAMGAALDEAAGSDSPTTSRVRGLLEDILALANRYAPPDLGSAEQVAEPEAEEAGVAAADTPGGGAGAARRAPETREDMLKELARIADFFRRTEPHSPLSYTLDEAVRRGRMSLPDLLAELVPDQNARNAFLTQLGIKPPE